MPLAIITGASSGIGRQVAMRLARRGYRTVLVARRADLLTRLAGELSAFAPSTAAPLDLGSEADIEPGMAAILHEHGEPAVLVNNAGFGFYGTFLEHTLDLHRRLMQVNYFAVIAILRQVLPVMRRSRRGHVINIASMSTKMGPWGHAGYAASKAALVSLTQTLACEYAQEGLHFSYVNPGIIDTEYFDAPCFAGVQARLRRYAVSSDCAARKIVGLLDRPRLELCIPRYYRVLDLICALSPGLARRIVGRESRPAAGAAAPAGAVEAQPAEPVGK